MLAVVERFLDALTSHDADATRELMTEEGVFHRVETGGEDVVLRSSSHGEIVQGVEEGSGDYAERLREPTVLVHGPIAVVWAPYEFHVDGELRHCGIDAFSLVETGDGAWKIAGIVYTAEDATSCPN
ncbi:MAG: nuclear transport factor 2 family protein [Thermoanaerobaculia bacterium]|nr:nuclear transport factor 2 family protein [Thermoanaerobaculia bacterium]